MLSQVDVGQREIWDWNLILDSGDLSTKFPEGSFTLTPAVLVLVVLEGASQEKRPR